MPTPARCPVARRLPRRKSEAGPAAAAPARPAMPQVRDRCPARIPCRNTPRSRPSRSGRALGAGSLKNLFQRRHQLLCQPALGNVARRTRSQACAATVSLPCPVIKTTGNCGNSSAQHAAPAPGRPCPASTDRSPRCRAAACECSTALRGRPRHSPPKVRLLFDQPAGQLPIDGGVIYHQSFDDEFHGHDRAPLYIAARTAGHSCRRFVLDHTGGCL